MSRTRIIIGLFFMFFIFTFAAPAAEIHDAARKGDLAKIETLVKADPV